MNQKIRIGTRGSDLALWQARHVADLLEQKGADCEIVIINTKGDLVLDRSLSKIGSKGVFTAELESALLSHEIDIAQHSAKDVQSKLPEGLELIAFTKREVVNDVLVSKNQLCSLNDKKLIVGTSSTRRVAILKHFYPHIQTVDIRGNLQTRISKLKDNHCNALLLAYAGIHRLGYESLIAQKLDIEEFTPPVGQGSVAIECASSLDSRKKLFIKEALNDFNTEQALLAEREFLYTLEGGCSIPSFGLAEINNNILFMKAGIVSLDGKKMVKEQAKGNIENAKEIGRILAINILSNGGSAILADIKSQQKLNELKIN